MSVWASLRNRPRAEGVCEHGSASPGILAEKWRVRVLSVSAKLLGPVDSGEVSERFKEHAWKACVGEILPWVQIPPSPPYFHNGKGNEGLAAEQEIFYKSFLWNLRTSQQSQYLAKARKSDAPAKVPALQAHAHQDQRQVTLLPSSDLLQ